MYTSTYTKMLCLLSKPRAKNLSNHSILLRKQLLEKHKFIASGVTRAVEIDLNSVNNPTVYIYILQLAVSLPHPRA